MADREIIHTNDGGGSGIGAMLGVILGALLVIGGLVYFLGDLNGGGSNVSVNVPSPPATTGAR